MNEGKATIAEYDFDEDALGLGDFIQQTISVLPDDDIVIYVADDEGRPAKKAKFVRELLTDGSTVVNLVIEFDRSLG